jgi:thiamine pyrophosphate-dependent acetolactate synthase large subunit-like protein
MDRTAKRAGRVAEAMGCRDWYCTSVQTNAEFNTALANARKHPGAAYIEVLLGCQTLVPAEPLEALDRIYQTGPPKTVGESPGRRR